jgi:hypothetical protein
MMDDVPILTGYLAEGTVLDVSTGGLSAVDEARGTAKPAVRARAGYGVPVDDSSADEEEEYLERLDVERPFLTRRESGYGVPLDEDEGSSDEEKEKR